MPRGVELARVAGTVGGDPFEQVLVDFRQHVDVGVVGEVQPVDLLHDAGKGRAAAAVVADVLEDAAESLSQRVVAEALLGIGAGELGPELAVDELQHLVRVVRVLGPRRPGVLAGQPPLVGRVVESRLLGAASFGLVERLQEEQPRQLLDVIAGVDAFGVQLVAGVLDDLLDFLAAMVDLVGHVRSCICTSAFPG